MKKPVTILLIASLFATIIAGCGGNQSQGADNPSDRQASNAVETVQKSPAMEDDLSEKLDISIMVSTAAGGGWPEDHAMIEKLNEALNVNLHFQWVPGDNYEEKMNVLAASNNFPDVFQIWNPMMYGKWLEKGVFLDLKPLLANYPNITKEIPEPDLQMMNPENKVYGLPIYAPAFRSNLSIRMDWLDRLHLNMPTTVDEFYEVAKAFATQDPDGNGKNDTIGFSMSVAPNGNMLNIDYLKGAFGLANEWKEADGQLIPQQVQAEEWKQLASFLHKAYAEGVLDKDFPVNKERDPWNKLEANTNGIAEVNPSEVYKRSLPTLQKLAPDADIVQLDPPKGPTGLQYANTIVSTAKVVVNSKVDEKKQQRIMKLFDYMLSDEGYKLIKNGIEGVHYKKDGDKYTVLEAFDTDRPYILSTWFLRRFDPGIQIRLWDGQEYEQKVMAWFNNTEQYRWTNPAAGVVSETNSKKGSELNQKLTAVIVKTIIGQEPIEAIDRAVEQWKADGGDKIIQEMNEAYAKLK